MAQLAHAPVTVLGGSGFLGRALCRHLAALGADVTSMSRHESTSGDAWKHITVDVTDAATLSARLAAARPQILFHLAGLASGRPDRELVVPMLKSHVLSMVNVLSYAAESDCQRVICAASLEEPEPSDAAPAAASPYAAAKWTASLYGRLFNRLYGTPVVFARVFMAYGPGPQNLTKVIPYTALSLLRGEETKLTSGSRPFDWVFIDDVAAGLAACATAPGLEGRLLDIGTGRTATVRDVANLIADLIGSGVRPVFGNIPDRAEAAVRMANVEQTYSLIGWRAAVDLCTGLERTLQWLRRHQSEFA